jgi:hypothetical protein
MGELPQLTRSLASKIADLPQVAEVTNHDGRIGAVDFKVDEGPLSSGRLDSLLPDSYRTSIVVTDSGLTTAYVEEQ